MYPSCSNQFNPDNLVMKRIVWAIHKIWCLGIFLMYVMHEFTRVELKECELAIIRTNVQT
jgi:hypothetical protein